MRLHQSFPVLHNSWIITLSVTIMHRQCAHHNCEPLSLFSVMRFSYLPSCICPAIADAEVSNIIQTHPPCSLPVSRVQFATFRRTHATVLLICRV